MQNVGYKRIFSLLPSYMRKIKRTYYLGIRTIMGLFTFTITSIKLWWWSLVGKKCINYYLDWSHRRSNMTKGAHYQTVAAFVSFLPSYIAIRVCCTTSSFCNFFHFLQLWRTWMWRFLRPHIMVLLADSPQSRNTTQILQLLVWIGCHTTIDGSVPTDMTPIIINPLSRCFHAP